MALYSTDNPCLRRKGAAILVFPESAIFDFLKKAKKACPYARPTRNASKTPKTDAPRHYARMDLPNIDTLLEISASNKAAPFDPVQLLLAGFYVFPLQGYRKYPTKLGGRGWSWYWDHSRLDILTAEGTAAAHQTGVTGWGICPKDSDTTPLLLLDVDDYSGKTTEEIWHELTNTDAAIPPGVGIVNTPSGGVHIWMRFPANVAPKAIPHAFDFGNGIKGEVRFSGQEAAKFLVMPGTRALNKKQQVSRYSVATTFNLTELEEPPPTLLARLTSRRGTDAKEDQDQVTSNTVDGISDAYIAPPSRKLIIESAMPTEFHHLMSIVQQSQVDEGGRNNFAAAVSQVVGRIYRKRLNETAIKLMVDSIQGAVGTPIPASELKRTIYSGIKRGQQNAKNHDSFAKYPGMTLVLTEAKSIFGSLPWVIMHLNSAGKPVAFEVGLGGDPVSRSGDRRSLTVLDFTIQSVLAALTKLSTADQDVVVRSPLFVSLSWSKVLMHWLRTSAIYEYVALPTEAEFWGTIQQWAMQAAEAKNFTDGLTLVHKDDNCLCHTTAAIVDKDMPAFRRLVLVIHPRMHEFLILACGDVGATKKLLHSFVDERRIKYPKNTQLAWCVEVNDGNIGEDTMSYIWAVYTDTKRKDTI